MIAPGQRGSATAESTAHGPDATIGGHVLALTIDNRTEHIELDRSDDAMLRYWQAKQSGDTSARLIRVTRPPANPTEPVAPGEVSQVARARIEAQQRWLDGAGFVVPPPLYAPGTKVVDLGERNFRVERRRVEALPSFADAASEVTCVIGREGREDRVVPLSSVAMTDAGALTVDGEELALETGAFHQLAQLSGFGPGARYLSDHCSPELRAYNVNAQLRAADERKLTLRTRGRGPQRSVFATVTPTYSAIDTDAVLGAVCDGLHDARAELSYDGSGVRATALWMPDQVVDLAAGDIFKVGVRVETDDTGRGRIRVAGVVWRNRCLNLIVIGEGEVETVSQVHRGEASRILERVQQGVEAAREKVGHFLAAWGHARTVQMDVPAVLRAWVEERKLRLPGIRSAAERDAAVDVLLRSWHREPGDTLADAVNAVTRAAHEEPSWGLDIREELERQAARLVLVAA